jgi:hypothetical protein
MVREVEREALCFCAMRLRIVGDRAITSPAGLTTLELEQLYATGRAYDGEDRAPELRFVDASQPGHEDGWYLATIGVLSVAEVHEGDRHVYDLWRIDPDSATLFAAGTRDLVAGRCQSSWMTPDLMEPFEHAVALDEAMKAAGVW